MPFTHCATESGRKTTRNKRNISVKFRTTCSQMAVRLFIYGQNGINIYKSNRFDDAVRSTMNTIFSPVQTFKNTCQFSFFFSFLFFAIFAAFTTFHAPVRVVRFRVHQPVGHILFQHFINRPFEFQFLRLVLSQHFLPLLLLLAADLLEFEFMEFEWRRLFDSTVSFSPFVLFVHWLQ